MTVVRVRWGWLRVAVVDTRWPTEHGKSAQSITNICPWKSELTFQCTRSFFLKRIKTHLLIYHSQRTQSSSWQVSLTCFTHLQKKQNKPKTCLPAPVMNEPRSVCVVTQSHTRPLGSLITVRRGKKNKIYKHCQLMPEVTLKKNPKKTQLQ